MFYQMAFSMQTVTQSMKLVHPCLMSTAPVPVHGHSPIHILWLEWRLSPGTGKNEKF